MSQPVVADAPFIVPAAAESKTKKRKRNVTAANAEGTEAKPKRKRTTTKNKNKSKEVKEKFAFPDTTALPPIGSLQGLTFCTTGRLPASKEQMIAFVELHGGKFTAKLTQKATHVVAADPTLVSDKMNVAKKRGTQVVSLQWLQDRCREPGAPPVVSSTNDEKKKKSKTKGTGKGESQVKIPGLKVLLAKNYHDVDIDPTGWLGSEKLDGVRAYWDGTRFLSREGNEYFAPAFFTAMLPKDVHLDGELYGGRKTFQKTVGIVKSHDKTEEWKTLVYKVFDAPNCDAPFERRLELLYRMFPLVSQDNHPYVQVHDQLKVVSKDWLEAWLKHIESEGGEGVMLRKPGSKYERRRSDTLLKVKSFRDDDAIVVKHQQGKGKNADKMGSLIVKRKDGVTFKIGSGFDDIQRENPPALGSVVTYKYQELTDGGKPRFPVFLRVRPDVDPSVFAVAE